MQCTIINILHKLSSFLNDCETLMFTGVYFDIWNLKTVFWLEGRRHYHAASDFGKWNNIFFGMGRFITYECYQFFFHELSLPCLN